MVRLLRSLLVLLMLCLGGVARAEHIKATLIAESDRPAAGSMVTLAVEMRPEGGWHGYWRNPGDSGLPDRATWSLPAGVTAGELAYPVPRRLILTGLMNHVYEAPYALLARLELPAALLAGTRLPIRLKLDYLVCSAELCVPETALLALDLVVGNGTIDPDRRRKFDGWRAALPRPLGSGARFTIAEGRFRIAIPLPAGMAVDDPWFFALSGGALAYAGPQRVTRADDTLILEGPAGPAPPERVEGVLAIGQGVGLSLTAVRGTVPPAGAALDETRASRTSLAAILLALGGAMLGGLLLNVMPCVFPILSLKALSLARAGGDGGAARRESIAYTAGIMLVCVVLGGILLALRAAGVAAGWAFQLQDPRIILLLLLLVSSIAFNLAGLFELGTLGGGSRLAGAGGGRGAFWTGALAAFVATPCTGPFMSAAMGAALLLSPVAALAVFAGLGLGLALPFLLLGFSQSLRSCLPRPGAWMNGFRRILAVPMFVTAIGLTWVLGRQAGVDGMTLGLAAVVVLGLALWWVGRRQARGARHAWLPLAPALLIAFAGATIPTSTAPAAARAGPLGEPFSEARLAALQAQGRPVFVYFTADWCLTCKVNEKAAIERAEVAAAFRTAKVAVLVGDWTRGEPAISRFLEAHGRSGVPLYLFYRPDKPVEELPQVLTVDRLVALTKRPA